MARTFLPDEIIVLIGSFATGPVLKQLQQASHAFYRCITPILYHSIFWSDTLPPSHLLTYDPAIIPASYYYAKRTAPYRLYSRWATEVSSLTLLLRTLRYDSKLRPLVVTAGFELLPTSTPNTQTDVRDLIAILEPSLRCLHLAPGDLQPALWLHAPIRSFQLNLSGSGYEHEPFGALKTSPLPENVVNFVLEGVRSWNGLYGPQLTVKQISFLKSIESLSFPYSIPCSTELNELLKWPQALKSFYLEAKPNEDGYYTRRAGDPAMSLSAPYLIDALEPQRRSLEEIFVIGLIDMMDPHVATVGTLRSFERLTRLGIRSDWIRRLEDEDRDADSYGEEWPVLRDAVSRLPPLLEELQLQFEHGARESNDNSLSWIETFGELPSIEIEDQLRTGEMSRFLSDIAAVKDSLCVKLRKVFVWEYAYGTGREVPRYVDIGVLQACSSFLDAFAAAQVDFKWFINGAPPLFSTWAEEDWVDATHEEKERILKSGLSLTRDPVNI